jgi:hypothetical protein
VPDYSGRETSLEIQDVKVYPNPANNMIYFNVISDSPIEKLSLKVFDLTGKQVQEINTVGSSFLILYRENIASGLYHYILLENNEVINTGKIVWE